jgi:uncharacterized protein
LFAIELNFGIKEKCNMKKVLVIGASINESRYSNKAVKALREHGYDVVAIGNKPGKIDDIEILNYMPQLSDIHTVTLYINPEIQKEYFDYILSLEPKRIIFNPGTENLEFSRVIHSRKIEALEHCTLVMLSIGVF